MIFSEKINKAIQFAITTHEIDQKQKRKGKDIPYIVHPITVGLILARVTKEEDVIVAGILHDTVEDCIPYGSITKKTIEKKFGSTVANLVMSVTETNKNLSWGQRKMQAIEHIKTFSKNSLLIKSADVISNLNELIDDYEREGLATFKRFNAPAHEIIKHYLNVILVIIEKWHENPLGKDLVYLSNKFLHDNRLRSLCDISTITHEDIINRNFSDVEVYINDDHFIRKLIRDDVMNELYFYQFSEEIDYENGNDPQYRIYIPVDSVETARLYKNLDRDNFLKLYPQLIDFWLADNSRITRWLFSEVLND